MCVIVVCLDHSFQSTRNAFGVGKWHYVGSTVSTWNKCSMHYVHLESCFVHFKTITIIFYEETNIPNIIVKGSRLQPSIPQQHALYIWITSC